MKTAFLRDCSCVISASCLCLGFLRDLGAFTTYKSFAWTWQIPCLGRTRQGICNARGKCLAWGTPPRQACATCVANALSGPRQGICHVRLPGAYAAKALPGESQKSRLPRTWQNACMGRLRQAFCHARGKMHVWGAKASILPRTWQNACLNVCLGAQWQMHV